LSVMLLRSLQAGRLIAIIGCLMFSSMVYSPVLADIYVFVDREGVMHFTNAPTQPGARVFIKEKRRTAVRRRRGNTDPAKYDHLIHQYSQKHGVDPSLVKAVIRAESDFDPYTVSSKGAEGLMQLMPETSEKLNVFNPFDPRENIEAGVKYFKYLLQRFDHDLKLSLAAYNAGETVVTQYGGIPPYDETKTYVARVMQYYDEYKRRPLMGARNP